MADFCGWGAGMVGVAVRCNWRLEDMNLLHTEKTQSRKYTYTSGFYFDYKSRRQSYCACRGVVLRGTVRSGPSTRSPSKNLHVISWEPSYLLLLTTGL